MRDEDDMRWAAAVHEAGHVVVAWALGLQVQAISVTDKGEGRSEIESAARCPLCQQIAVAEAGMIAADLLSAPTWPQAGMTDAVKVMELLERHAAPSCKSAEGHTYARQILNSRTTLVRDLAIALDRAGSLSGADLEDFAGRCPHEKSCLAA
jgi:hypothetical protein